VRVIENIFPDYPTYRNALGCPGGPPSRLVFLADDERGEVLTRFQPQECHASFPGIFHGGLQATLVDEVAFWTVWDRYRKLALTIDLQLRFRRPTPAQDTITVRGRIVQEQGRLIRVAVRVLDHQQRRCTDASVRFYLAPRTVWARLFGPLDLPEHLFPD
jgi:uncharacterized protein (TIGR00369 family)